MTYIALCFEICITNLNYSQVKCICITKNKRGDGIMQHDELVFRFHNPNSEKDTYRALAEIFADVGCKKLKNALIEAEQEQTDRNIEKE